MRVFLSYRRGDAGGYAGRLTDALLQRLGARSVFHDVTAISPGEDYTVAIDRALVDCDAALVVIGPGWLTVTSPQGARRLFEPGDYVRLELATILRRDIRAIPVLVGGARLPKAAELPDDLQALAQRQAVELHDETWHERRRRAAPVAARRASRARHSPSPLAGCRNSAHRAVRARRGGVVAVGARHRRERPGGGRHPGLRAARQARHGVRLRSATTPRPWIRPIRLAS